MVGMLDLKFSEPKFKSCSDNQMDLSPVKLHSYPCTWPTGLPPASCGSCCVYLSYLEIVPVESFKLAL